MSATLTKRWSAACDWEGTLSDYLDKHKNKTCKFKPVACPLECGKMVPVHQLKKHKASECEHRLVECNLCKAEMKHNVLEHHCRSECPLARVSCQYCKMRMLRVELGEEPSGVEYDGLPDACSKCERKYSGHYRFCPKMPVKCDFYNHGCTQTLRREELEDHHARNGRRHAQLVAEDKGWHSQKINWGVPSASIIGTGLWRHVHESDYV